MVDRYFLHSRKPCDCTMETISSGYYVKHDDYAALEKERDALAERLRWKKPEEFSGRTRDVLVKDDRGVVVVWREMNEATVRGRKSSILCWWAEIPQ